MASFTIKFGNLDKTSNGNVYSDINVTNLSDKKITDKNAIKQSIYNMLHWRMGERVLFPDFGNPLYSYLFETINSSTIEQIKLAIRKMFTYEPRVKIDNIDIKNYSDEQRDATFHPLHTFFEIYKSSSKVYFFCIL